jgi:serine protease AprX
LQDIISNAIASPNPIGNGTVISFSTNKEAYVKIEVFDLLGNVVTATSFESVLQSGNHSVPIATHNLAAGTYYARILTTYGEVQTVKLVKE